MRTLTYERSDPVCASLVVLLRGVQAALFDASRGLCFPQSFPRWFLVGDNPEKAAHCLNEFLMSKFNCFGLLVAGSAKAMIPEYSHENSKSWDN